MGVNQTIVRQLLAHRQIGGWGNAHPAYGHKTPELARMLSHMPFYRRENASDRLLVTLAQ